VAEKTEKAEEYELTNADWGKIHAMAWCNKKEHKVRVTDAHGKPVLDAHGKPVLKDFSEVLETDPTAAIMFYAEICGLKYKKLKIVKLRPAPDPDDIPYEFWEDVNPFPPSCC
jgi:hypothetical protein